MSHYHLKKPLSPRHLAAMDLMITCPQLSNAQVAAMAGVTGPWLSTKLFVYQHAF